MSRKGVDICDGLVFNTYMTTNTCLTCQLTPAVLAGTATLEERNHWSLWGCTCDPAAEAAAAEWVAEVTQ